MPGWESRIERVNNGFICTTYVPEEDDKYTVVKDVFSDSEHFDDDVRSFIDLCRFLAEYYGVQGSKHDKQRLWIGLVDQDGKLADDR